MTLQEFKAYLQHICDTSQEFDEVGEHGFVLDFINGKLTASEITLTGVHSLDDACNWVGVPNLVSQPTKALKD